MNTRIRVITSMEIDNSLVSSMKFNVRQTDALREPNAKHQLCSKVRALSIYQWNLGEIVAELANFSSRPRGSRREAGEGASKWDRLLYNFDPTCCGNHAPLNSSCKHASIHFGSVSGPFGAALDSKV